MGTACSGRDASAGRCPGKSASSPLPSAFRILPPRRELSFLFGGGDAPAVRVALGLGGGTCNLLRQPPICHRAPRGGGVHEDGHGVARAPPVAYVSPAHRAANLDLVVGPDPLPR